jgi:hypothetical protein
MKITGSRVVIFIIWTFFVLSGVSGGLELVEGNGSYRDLSSISINKVLFYFYIVFPFIGGVVGRWRMWKAKGKASLPGRLCERILGNSVTEEISSNIHFDFLSALFFLLISIVGTAKAYARGASGSDLQIILISFSFGLGIILSSLLIRLLPKKKG